MSIALRILPFLLLITVMFFYPQEVLKSASTGLSLWANFVLPALFPFFIISDLLMKQGFVHFLGALLEPFMRPVFHLPGKASFVVAMTHTSGIPIGAILTCKMRKDGEITKTEGERLLAFTSNPSPGFMFGAVASGMLGNPTLGIILAGSVYISNLIVGFLFRFYGLANDNHSTYPFSFRKAWNELALIQEKNKKPFGAMLADAVRDSTSTILLVGGFIVFFSVITQMITVLHINTIFSAGTTVLTRGLLPPSGGNALIQGFLETTLGCKAAVTAFGSLNAKVGMLSFLMGWGGLSVFAQVASFTTTTDLRFYPFVLGRCLHACLAFVTSQVLLRFSEIPTLKLPVTLTGMENGWIFTLKLSCYYFFWIILILLIVGLTYKMSKRVIRKR
ncbi:MAG: sporulation integral membrane protein YlbJ [Peptococcaceae bacterium]|nr:sporulation integral membrane protein YlbJ [Peptococcaceae bacterium]